MTTTLTHLVAQGIPLAPPLNVRLIALAVVEVVLLLLVVLLYIRWDQLKSEPLGKWWARRRQEGLSRKSLFAMQESELERRAAEGAAAAETAQPSAPGGPTAPGAG